MALIRDSSGNIIGVVEESPPPGESSDVLWVSTGTNTGATGNDGETLDFNWDPDIRVNNDDPDPDPGGVIFIRGIVESVGAFDQKQERIVSSGPLRPTIVEDKDSDGTSWVNKQAISKDGEGIATYKFNTATTLTKLRLKGFRAGIPQSAKIRGFKVTIKRRKRALNAGVVEDTDDPLLKETIKLDFNKWQLKTVD